MRIRFRRTGAALRFASLARGFELFFAVRLVDRTSRDRRLLERFDFFFRQRPNGAGRQIAEPHRADGDAFEPLHFVADAGEQAADFAIAAFVEHHFQDRRLLAAALDSDVFDVGEAFGQVDAAMKLAEDFVFDLTGDLHVVNLFDAVTRVGEAVGQFAIVGDDDQAFGRHVEPADAKHARRVGRHADRSLACGRPGRERWQRRRSAC